MKGFLKKGWEGIGNHLFAILFALIVGILSGLPSLLAPRGLGTEYRGIPFLYQSDEEIYLSRIQEVLDGYPSIGSPVLHEYKQVKTAWFPFGEYLYVLPVLVGVPLIKVLLLSKFVFPALLFLLVYMLTLCLIKSGNESRLKVRQGIAIATGLLVTLGYDFVHVSHIISLPKDSHAFYLSPWTRLVNPVTGGLIFFGGLIALWKYLEAPSRKMWGLLCGLLLLSSSYFFSFGIFLTVLTYWTVVSFFVEKKKNEAIWLLLLLCCGGGMLLVQALIGRVGISHEEAAIALTKNGLLFTHLPLVNGVLLATSGIFALLTVYGVKKRLYTLYPLTAFNRFWWFLLGGLVASFVVFSQQFLTGRTIWPHHFVQYTIPLCYIVLLTMFARSIVRVPTRYVVVVLLPIVVATVGFGMWAATTYKAKMEVYKEVQQYQPLFTFLNHTPKGMCTVLSVEEDDYLSTKIPAFTHCDVYYSIFVYYGAPLSRIEHNYLTLLRFRGLTSATLPQYLIDHDVEMRVATFTNWQELFRHVEDPWMRKITNNQEVDTWIGKTRVKIEKDYAQFLKQDFKSELQRYQITYIVWDKVRYPQWNPTQVNFLTEVYSDSRVVVYQIK